LASFGRLSPQLSVTPPLSGKFEPDGKGGWTLDYKFVMQPGIRRIPKPPIP